MAKAVVLLALSILLLAAAVQADPRGWSNDTRITFSNEDIILPTMATNSVGNHHIAWSERFNGLHEVFYKKLDNTGRNLTSDVRITFDENYSFITDIDVDTLDNVHLVWENYQNWMTDVMYAKLDSVGRNLTPNIQLTTSGAVNYPSLAVDNNGNIHIVWQDYRDGNGTELYYTKLDNNGNTLIDDRRITFAWGNSDIPTIAIDGDNNVHIAWIDARDMSFEIYYKKLDNNGLNLTSDIRLTQRYYKSFFPSIGVDRMENVHIAWMGERTFRDEEIYYTKLDNNGNTLVDDTQISFSSSIAESPVLVVDKSDYVHITWTDDRDGNYALYYKKLNNDGVNVTGEIRITMNAADAVDPSLTVDNYNNAHVVWSDVRNGVEVYYKRALPPQIELEGLPVIGNIVYMNLSDPSNPNKAYRLAFSIGTTPGIPLDRNRMIPLFADNLFYTSMQNPSSIGLYNSEGILDASGRARVQWDIPNIPELAGTVIFMSVISFDQNQPLPQAVLAIAPAVNATLSSNT